MAFEAKDFLIDQERCEDVQLEQRTYCGRNSKTCQEEERKKKEKEERERREKRRKEEKEEL